MTTTPKTKAKAPTDDVSDIVAKAMKLRVAVLQAKQVSDEVNTSAGQAIGEANVAFEVIRDEENTKMLVEAEKVEVAQAILTAYGEEADQILGVTNALGALLGPVGTATAGTQQVSL